MSNQKEFHEVMRLIFEGKLDPIIDKIYPLDKAKDAENYLKRKFDVSSLDEIDKASASQYIDRLLKGGDGK